MSIRVSVATTSCVRCFEEDDKASDRLYQLHSWNEEHILYIHTAEITYTRQMSRVKRVAIFWC